MGFFSKIFGGILNGYASRNLEKKMKNDKQLQKHVDAMGNSARKLKDLLDKKESNESMKDIELRQKEEMEMLQKLQEEFDKEE